MHFAPTKLPFEGYDGVSEGRGLFHALLRAVGLGRRSETPAPPKAVFHSALAMEYAGKRAVVDLPRSGFIKSAGWRPVLVQRSLEESRAAPQEPETLPITPLLRSNYQRYGAALGATSAEDYALMAQDFLKLASRFGSVGYTFLKLGPDVFAVDYREGDMRALYRKNGQPIAFFIPNYLEAGFASREEEFRHWVSTGRRMPQFSCRL